MNQWASFPFEVKYFNGLGIRSVVYDKQGNRARWWILIRADPVRVKPRTIKILQRQFYWIFIGFVEVKRQNFALTRVKHWVIRDAEPVTKSLLNKYETNSPSLSQISSEIKRQIFILARVSRLGLACSKRSVSETKRDTSGWREKTREVWFRPPNDSTQSSLLWTLRRC